MGVGGFAQLSAPVSVQGVFASGCGGFAHLLCTRVSVQGVFAHELELLHTSVCGVGCVQVCKGCLNADLEFCTRVSLLL